MDTKKIGMSMEKILIDTKSNSALVHFNTKFYNADQIMKAARSYSESCWVLVDGDKEGIIQVCLTPKSKDMPLDNIGYEFYNFVLGTIKNS